MHDTFLRQLTPSQKKAVLHVEGPLLVLAGPGSGKTRVIIYRIAALIDSGIQPYNICAITFTNRAADEMRQRAAALGASGGAHISTFHSLCVRILRRYAAQAKVQSNFSVYDDSDQKRCMKQAIKDCELDSSNFPPGRMLDAISSLKNQLIDADTFKAGVADFFSKILAEIYVRYQKLLSERNGLDFDDLLMKTAFLLRDSGDVCGELGERFKFLLIDEYQDTNHAQYTIARLLVSRHNNICATGDPDQSIYRWRGADVRNILAFEKDWPDAKVVRLEENFRSAAAILEKADNLIAYNQKRKEKKLIPTKPYGKDVLVESFEDEVAEARAVAQQVKELSDKGASLSDIAVFYRVNAMSRGLEEAFIRHKIPYQVVRGIEFYRRKEIRDLLAYLKVLVNPDDEIALLRIINTPARGIGKITIDRVHSYAGRCNISVFEGLKKVEHIEALSKGAKAKLSAFADMLDEFKKDIDGPRFHGDRLVPAKAGIAPLAQRVFDESGLAESLRSEGADGQNALENVNELINSITAYDQQAEEPSLLDYIQQISLFSDVDGYDTSSERVALMTLHAAKGLEFENVFIVGVEHGLLPHERSTAGENDDELEEERRLLFVGMTRAKTGLYLSYARYRTIRGQMLRTIPSQFLFESGCDFAESASSCHSRESGNLYHDDNGNDNRSVPYFTVGQLVRHDSFGLGRVKEFIDMGEDSVVIIKFNTGRTKSLMVKYAGLSKMDGL